MKGNRKEELKGTEKDNSEEKGKKWKWKEGEKYNRKKNEVNEGRRDNKYQKRKKIRGKTRTTEVNMRERWKKGKMKMLSWRK